MRRREFLKAALVLPFVQYAGRTDAAGPRGGRGAFLVTADKEAQVLAVDAASARVTRRIPTAPGPRGIDATANGQTAVVCHTNTGVVSIISVEGLAVRHTLESIAEPRYAVFASDHLAYVSDSVGGALHVVELSTGHVIGRLDLDGAARHLSISPSGDRIWLGLGNASQRVAIIDISQPRRPRLVRYVATPHRAHDLAFSSDGREVWISSGARRQIAVFGARTGRQLALMDADAPPQHFVMLPGAAWVGSGESGTLRVHDLATREVRHRLVVPKGSYNVTSGAGRVATPSLDLGTLTTIDRHTGTIARSNRVAIAAHDACFIAGG